MNNIEKVTLPSNGLLEGTPKEVTIRGMLGRELSTLFSSLNEAAIEKIITSVVEEELDIELLTDEDKLFILHKTRVLTFGQEVQQTLRCPVCGKIHDYVVNYDDLDVKLLQEEQINPVINLNDKVAITKRIPNNLVWGEIESFKKKIKTTPDMTYTLLYAARIEKINGKKKSILEIVEFLDSLLGKDFTKLTKALDTKFGLDTTYNVSCKSCEGTFTGVLGVNADLFREPDSTL